ncbi:MAG TPA: response regulator transcription factor [Acidimicrobiales bacterium]|nr:response regulator transcription factor [Acidimicrobiales bacterium]
MRILVVEDEPDLAGAIATGLRREGYAVDIAADGRSALERLPVTEYDLVCLDLNLPDIDGLEVCREIVDQRANDPARLTRVLMLTARGGVEERIEGLDQGADDYMVKPFALGELLARMRALLRRESGATGALIQWNDLVLDGARQEVRNGNVLVELNPKEYALLRWFLLHPNEVHSAERLLEHVWDEHADPFTNTVRVTLSNLRRKLAAAGATDVIETLPGRGYRLAAA